MDPRLSVSGIAHKASGGSAYREEFERERTTEYTLTGSKNNIFFILKRHPEKPNVLVAQVKDEISQASSFKPPIDFQRFGDYFCSN